MNTKQSPILMKMQEGKDAWNEWAKNSEEAKNIDFSGKKFNGPSDLSGFEFPGKVRFNGTKFRDDILLNGSVFIGEVEFDGAIFDGKASFNGTKFRNKATFNNKAKFNKGADFKKAEFNKGADFKKAEFGQNKVEFDGAIFGGKASFNGTRFGQDATFNNVRFDKISSFLDVRFESSAQFNKAIFRGKSRFKKSSWYNSSFQGTVFCGAAYFSFAEFNGNVSFANGRFRKKAHFKRSIFNASVCFKKSTFKGQADFSAIDCKSKFTIRDVEFQKVPDFIQASFVEAPQLVEVKQLGPIKIEGSKEARHQQACWRALRRLALRTQDHIGELSYYGEEIKARRGMMKRSWHPVHWLGWLYQCFSNFGRSLARPLLSWAVGLVFFMIVYFFLRNEEVIDTCCSIYWSDTPFKVWCAAFGLSLHRGLLALSSLGSSLPQYHEILYKVGTGPCKEPYPPIYEPYVGFAQVVFSTAMIFLFLLALRNQFRISR